MSDIIGIIQTVEDDEYQGKAHKKVTLEDGQVLKVKYGREGALRAKWDLLQEGVAIKFTMQEYTNPNGVKFPFVADIATVEGELPEAKEPAPLLEEHQKVIDEAGIDKAHELCQEALRAKPEPAPQAVGMITKEIGDMIRSKYLKPLFGDEAYIELIKWYRGQVLGITRIDFEGAKLPTLKKAQEEDVPF